MTTRAVLDRVTEWWRIQQESQRLGSCCWLSEEHSCTHQTFRIPGTTPFPDLIEAGALAHHSLLVRNDHPFVGTDALNSSIAVCLNGERHLAFRWVRMTP